ncbi:transcriptional regulator [Neisseria sp. HMSC077D05]|jgi:ribonuclease T|uniref:DNA-binding helix-turn-helix protein n=1 Tax=Neisseria sicca VK64 TaxID=1095748 RepID=I2NQL6_NEISI|nr:MULTISPECIES: helix-turn-helix transcriptional regulator [Neisseria]EIG28127.1 DNA-binding helix-turn-helix protein [Neisseria sicca VK64]OFN31807.1 transcriptional regulator [Neisseria sp. HMSC077D05]
MSVNNKIRALRELNNWSQEDMAERLNMSKSSYSRLERDERKLDLVKLEKLAAIFKIDIGELIASDDKELVLLIGTNNSNNPDYGVNGQIKIELEKLKLGLEHSRELLAHKDLLLAQKDREISALRQLVAQLQK